jgi:uncharacterized protein YdeI (BOF family)
MKRLNAMIWSSAILLTVVLVAPAMADPGEENQKQPNPYAMANNTWISISGTVKAVTPNTFTLDYGDGVVIIEMDDGDRDADAYKLLEGDKVTVNGKIDDDFYEMTKIEATSVYVEKLGTYFYASPIDEEDGFFVTMTSPIILPITIVRGTVTDVREDEFVLDTGLRRLTVEVDEMPYNPLDDEGYQKIRVGDFVKVTGEIDNELFEGHELEAASVIKLYL